MASGPALGLARDRTEAAVMRPGRSRAALDPGRERRVEMLYWALVFLVVAIIAGLFGFGGIASTSASIAQVLFFIFLVLLVVSLVMYAVRGRPPPV
jgi:uncharacterized membrane protein YtjA (UPF0391 family)